MYLLSSEKSPNYGTALVQRVRGLGLYLRSADASPNYGTALVQRVRGLGCAGCCSKCSSGSGCDRAGLGMFDSLDFSTWGPLEWIVVGLGGFAAYSMLSTTSRGVRQVRKSVRAGRAAAARKAQLRRELDAI